MTKRIFWVRYRGSAGTDHIAVEATDATIAGDLARDAGYLPELVTAPPPVLAAALELVLAEVDRKAARNG